MVLTTTNSVTATITTTVRVVDCIHYYTADRWANALLAIASGFTDFDVLVLFVADHTNDSHAFNGNSANFAARQFDLGVVAFFRHKLGAAAG